MFNSTMKKSISIVALLMALSLKAFWADTTKELYVEEVYPTWTNKIEVVFSNEIAESSLKEDGSLFRMEEVNNAENSYDIKTKELDELDKNVMILTLNKDMVDWKEYRLIVLKVEDKLGQNIKYGVDSEATFTYRYNSNWGTSDNAWALNSASEQTTTWATSVEESNETDTVVLGEDNTNETGSALAGTGVDSSIENQIDVVANNNDKLPTAWPEHILLLIVALMLWGGVFLYNFKRS